LACISAAGLGGIFIIEHSSGNLLVILGLIGACLAFLRYNLHPASIFLGDTGSMFLGFMLGTISLDTCTKNTFLLSLTIPMLVLGVPIYDTMLAIWRRSVRQMWVPAAETGGPPKRSGIMQPDLDHLHHRLLKSGLSTRRVATVLCGANASLVILGLLVATFESHAAGIFLLALLAGVYVLMRHLAIIELRDTGAALLRGLRRPTPVTLKALGYPAWDMTAMAAAVAIAKWLADGYSPTFWNDWFLSLPVWLTPTFALLAVSRTYLIIWSRARMRDVLKLFLTLEIGLLLSIGLMLMVNPHSDVQSWLIYALLIFGLGHSAILGLRVAYRILEELVSWTRSKTDAVANPQRIVLYGTGARCWLLLRELGFHSADHPQGRTIVGMIDDDESLHGRWVYGYRVLGGRDDLPRLIPSTRITGIIITAKLTPASRAAVRRLAMEQGLELSEWTSGEQILVPAGGPAQTASAPKAIPTPVIS